MNWEQVHSVVSYHLLLKEGAIRARKFDEYCTKIFFGHVCFACACLVPCRRTGESLAGYSQLELADCGLEGQ